MTARSITDPIESTWPTLQQTHIDLAAFHIYELVKPGDGLSWDELSPGQKADYRRRVMEACRATEAPALLRAFAAGPCPTDEQIAAWTEDGLPADEATRVIDHAASCDRCRRLIANVLGHQFENAIREGAE